MLKTIGYSISSISVLCLGFVSLDGAKGKPLLMAVLLIGMATSIIGMALRWVSFSREQQAKGKRPTELEGRAKSQPMRAAAARGQPQIRISK